MFEMFHNRIFKRINVLQLIPNKRLLCKQENVDIVDLNKTISESLREWILEKCIGSRVGPALLEDFLFLLLLGCPAPELRIASWEDSAILLQGPSRFLFTVSAPGFLVLGIWLLQMLQGLMTDSYEASGVQQKRRPVAFSEHLCMCHAEAVCIYRREALKCKTTALPHASSLRASSNHSQRHRHSGVLSDIPHLLERTALPC